MNEDWKKEAWTMIEQGYIIVDGKWVMQDE